MKAKKQKKKTKSKTTKKIPKKHARKKDEIKASGLKKNPCRKFYESFKQSFKIRKLFPCLGMELLCYAGFLLLFMGLGYLLVFMLQKMAPLVTVLYSMYYANQQLGMNAQQLSDFFGNQLINAYQGALSGFILLVIVLLVYFALNFLIAAFFKGKVL